MSTTVWKQPRKILITCPKGIPPYLQGEIEALGFPILSEMDAAIQTEGTLEDSLRLNLHLRTAHRVLFQLETFPAGTPGDLYGLLTDIPWEDYIHDRGRSAYVCVTSTVDHQTISDSRFVNLKVKDAVVDRIRDRCGRRPDSGPDRGRAVVHVYWKGDRAEVYLDTSGEPLSRRGYRKIPLQAPMQETLAAAVILATDWSGEGAFVNPMCGSGTLAIEAAWIALNRAPGLLRNNFGFMHIKGFPEPAWQALRKKAREVGKKHPAGRIMATDISRKAVGAAIQNAKTAGVEHLIEFSVCPYEKSPVPGGGGVVVLNPPYGERQGEASQLEETYRGIGDFFKGVGDGYSGYIFTGNPALAKKVGLRTRRRIVFYNSEIECRLLEYALYHGAEGGTGR